MPSQNELRLKFFDWVYHMGRGYICIAYAPKDNPRRDFRQKFFHWPEQREEIVEFVDLKAYDRNVWFSVNLFEKPERLKEYAMNHNLVWADLDSCHPSKVTPAPSLVIQSSPARFQALWKIDQNVPPDVAEDYSKRIAYAFKQEGADPTGWDLSQLLRVPYTQNLKYDQTPQVLLTPGESTEAIAPFVFEEIAAAPASEGDVIEEDMPDVKELPDTDKILYKYKAYYPRFVIELIEVEPRDEDDWSTRMWKLINCLFEAGMEKEEVFAVAISAKCNKYRRDHRPVGYLWREVLKAHIVQKRITGLTEHWEPLLMPTLVETTEQTTTIIDDYYEWACEATDAVPEFHRLTGAIILSCALCSVIRLKTSYGPVVPNLWGLILGDSTLTRKTTAMDMGVSILNEVDPEILLASDGSAEGLLTGLSVRPNRVSLFYRDEISGLFSSFTRKDSYLSAMPEILTKLYDTPKYYPRLLRKETIIVENAPFIFFGGGIRDRVYANLNQEYVSSGFLPRFIVVIGEADIDKLKRTGPPLPDEMVKRQKIVNRLIDTRERFQVERAEGAITIAGTRIEMSDMEPIFSYAELTKDAWRRYGDIEEKLARTANDSYYSDLALPTFERLSRSMLKLSCLLAAVDKDPEEGKFEVTEQDIINAAGYVQIWGQFSVELILNAGISNNMRMVHKIRDTVSKNPGVLSSDIMRMYHLDSRELRGLLQTLEDRGELKGTRKGRGIQLWPTT